MNSLQHLEERERVETARRPTTGGVSLERLLELGPLTPAEAVALAIGLLSELQDLERRGLQHGAVSGRNVQVTSEGMVLLRPPLAARPDSELGDDIRAAGDVICTALGLSPEAAGESALAVEASNPELVVAARALSQGALGRRSELAEQGFRQRVAALADTNRLADSRLEIGRLVVRAESGGLRRPRPPAAAAPAPAPELPPPARPALPQTTGPGSQTTRRGARLGAPLGAAALLLACAGLGLAAFEVGLWSGSGSATGDATPPAGDSAASATPAVLAAKPQTPVAVKPIPDYGPTAAGGITGIEVTTSQPCAAGRACPVQISVRYARLAGRPDFGWEFHAFDRCSGSDQVVGTGAFQAPAGWNHILVETPVLLPAAGHGLVLVAVSTRPARVASSPLEVAGVAC